MRNDGEFIFSYQSVFLKTQCLPYPPNPPCGLPLDVSLVLSSVSLLLIMFGFFLVLITGFQNSSFLQAYSYTYPSASAFPAALQLSYIQRTHTFCLSHSWSCIL